MNIMKQPFLGVYGFVVRGSHTFAMTALGRRGAGVTEELSMSLSTDELLVKGGWGLGFGGWGLGFGV